MKNLLVSVILLSALAVPANAQWLNSRKSATNQYQQEGLIFHKADKSLKFAYPNDSKQRVKEQGTRDFGYCSVDDEIMGLGIEADANFDCAILMTEATAQSMVGNKINKIKVGFYDASCAKNFKVWISTSLDGSKLMTQDVATVNTGWNEVTLDTPYEITGEAIYIGYSFSLVGSTPKEADSYPLGFGGSDNENGAYLNYGDGWGSVYGQGFGSLMLLAEISGEFYTHEVALTQVSYNRAVASNKYNLQVVVSNNGTESISQIDFNATVNGTTESLTAKFESPLTASSQAILTMPLTAPAETGTYTVDIEATKLDGVDDDVPSNNKISAPLLVVSEASPRKTVVEEGTGEWCGYCPRGAVGMNNLAEAYPDKFIGVAIHWNDDFQLNDYYDIVSIFAGFPSCIMDRVYETDPYYDADVAFEAVNARLSEAAVSLSARFTDDSKSELNVTSDVKFRFDSDECPYSLTYVLTEDGLVGSGQVNYYSGQSGLPSDLAWLSKESYTIMGYEHDHVAIGVYDCLGIEGSLTGAIKDGESKTHNYTIRMPRVNDLNNVKLVAMIISKETGEIVNAEELPLKNVVVGIDEMSANEFEAQVSTVDGQLVVTSESSDELSVEVYTAAGFMVNKAQFTGNVTLDVPAQGAYIVRVSDGNNVVVRKVVL